ncbi:MAG: DUF4382 domain-containing protein [Bacteroidota bacterium]|jgi:hypothetical protein
MKSIIKLSLSVFVLAGALYLAAGCKKDGQEGYMSVKLTDAPAEYFAVNVEIVGLEVYSEINGWISLPVNSGTYDLLQLQNNVTVLLAPKTEFPAGKITQMRLVLGTNHSVITGTGIFPLKTPSGTQSGLKINVNMIILSDKTTEVVLDFDAAASVVEEGNGSYLLKPVLRIKAVSQY